MTERQLIASRIKKARADAGLNQVEFAKEIGKANSTVAMYELGQSEPTASTLKRISEVTNKPVLWFISSDPASEELMHVPERLRPVVQLLIKLDGEPAEETHRIADSKNNAPRGGRWHRSWTRARKVLMSAVHDLKNA